MLDDNVNYKKMEQWPPQRLSQWESKLSNKKTHFQFLFEILLNHLDENIIFLMISIWALDEDIYTSLSFWEFLLVSSLQL